MRADEIVSIAAHLGSVLINGAAVWFDLDRQQKASVVDLAVLGGGYNEFSGVRIEVEYVDVTLRLWAREPSTGCLIELGGDTPGLNAVR